MTSDSACWHSPSGQYCGSTRRSVSPRTDLANDRACLRVGEGRGRHQDSGQDSPLQNILSKMERRPSRFKGGWCCTTCTTTTSLTPTRGFP